MVISLSTSGTRSQLDTSVLFCVEPSIDVEVIPSIDVEVVPSVDVEVVPSVDVEVVPSVDVEVVLSVDVEVVPSVEVEVVSLVDVEVVPSVDVEVVPSVDVEVVPSVDVEVVPSALQISVVYYPLPWLNSVDRRRLNSVDRRRVNSVNQRGMNSVDRCLDFYAANHCLEGVDCPLKLMDHTFQIQWLYYFSRERPLLPLDTLSCLSKLNIDLSYVARNNVILGIQLSEHVAHSGVDFCGYLIQRLGLNLLTVQQLLHHHTQTLQLIWLTVPSSWNSLPSSAVVAGSGSESARP
ncbi:hypothetical protein F2Q69_00007549 [Brassica cretica]|uniref:Uncharacterized protein n=1 Tax=Brassica cretica TaxID=69181 RepID=A0A8S9NXY6_BRACR|nr:hypothetical protein F2Q69_00007549 [Brassica cretica]